MGLLFGRVPKFERAVQDFLGSIIKRVTQVTFSDRKRAAELIRQLEEETGKLSRITPEEIVDWVRADGFRVKMHRNASLQAMGEVGIELSRHLSAMNWLLVRAPEDHPFVTSDAPFALLPPLNLGQPLGIGIGVTTPGATKLIPLTKRIALLIGDPGPIFAKRKATIEQVSAINAAVACNSFRLVVGPDEDAVRRVIDATMIDRVDP